ncbi:SUMF1/EgtB/PvdO family nonheme iron enzyme [Verrucomicrobiota bacterium]
MKKMMILIIITAVMCSVATMDAEGKKASRKKKVVERTKLYALTATESQPDCFIKKSSWQESLIASREALFVKECRQDLEQFKQTGISIGNWHYMNLGRIRMPKEPINPDQINVNKPLIIAGRGFKWIQCPNMKLNMVFDLNEQINMRRSETVLLYATVNVPRNLDESFEPMLGFAQTTGSLKCHKSTLKIKRVTENGQEINQHVIKLPTRRGRYGLLVEMRTNRKGFASFWYHPQVGSSRAQRIEAREALFDKVKQAFPATRHQAEIEWDILAAVWPTKFDWVPGSRDCMKTRYERFEASQIFMLEQNIAFADGPMRAIIDQFLEENISTGERSLQEIAQSSYKYIMLREAVAMTRTLKSATLAIKDQIKTFKDQYPNGKKYLAEIEQIGNEFEKWQKSGLAKKQDTLNSLFPIYNKAQEAQSRILLDNPLLKFDKLLLAKGDISLQSNWKGANKLGDELVSLSPVAPDGKLTTVHEGAISSYELDWDAQKILFSDGTGISEVNVDGSNLRTIKAASTEDRYLKRYNPCRMPNGDIMFVSTACKQAVPCTGGSGVGNMHVMDSEGNNERRITFDQDHNWDPCLLNNGRVVYLRWEYADIPHYFSRLLMSMNPDGTDQKEYYGSSSYWPNSMFWPRPIPGHPSKIVCIVSGHHGTRRAGELLILDPALGRHEADGAVQSIPGYGEKVEPVMLDKLVNDSWPKFITPYPLGTSPQEDGAGTYFLTTVQKSAGAPWQLCLVDIFDNITPILTGDYAMPVPLLKRDKPPVIPHRIKLESKIANVMISDIYTGPGLKGYPKGSVRALRVGTYHFRYPGNGDTYGASHEGGWDVKRIMGTVPVYEDGSAFFEVPANTPIFVQPIDAEGKALQLMRSWFTAMPGENLSCIGCHESQNTAPPSIRTIASRKPSSKIKTWNGPVRGFSFDREVQPVLDRKCVGCHDGSTSSTSSRKAELTTSGKDKERPDFKAKRLHKNFEDKYSPAYMALQKYIRRAGLENDYHMPVPSEYQADTSHLIKMLKKGHNNVKLTRDEWERLYTWIDYNIPYPAYWTESHRPGLQELIEPRAKYLKLYAGIDDTVEKTKLPLPRIARFQPPAKENRSTAKLSVKGWPLDPKLSKQNKIIEVDLGDDIKMKLTEVPAGKFIMGDADGFADEQPSIAEIKDSFYMGATEVTLAQYRQFKPDHENGYIETRRKDRRTRGDFCMDDPELPVVRITQQDAVAFCEWLSKKLGKKVALPTEQQWEWACRAGSNDRFYFGKLTENNINIADTSLEFWNYGRHEQNYRDFNRYLALASSYEPNAWGLYNMLGNVAEWTSSDYKPLPEIGVVDGTEKIPYKVVRGGSWNDTARFANSASRWRYPPYQPVYDVGFRVAVFDVKDFALAE